MNNLNLRFRQIHLDFHTSEILKDVGKKFDAVKFAQTLKDAHVNSITCFARCHHGMLYYDSKLFPERVHPGLVNKNILKEIIDECHRINIRVPIYITVQWDMFTSLKHPEWIAIDKNGKQIGSEPYKPGFYQVLCVNTQYRDFLKANIKEIMDTLDTDGIFLDIVYPTDCSCADCMAKMKKKGVDIYNDQARMTYAQAMIDEFKVDISDFIRNINPDTSIFYNTSHIGVLQRKVKDSYTHFELETLPSGNWGYLHFPITMRYARTLSLDCLAQTGKFHTEWGDFHSFKNKEALEYECFRMLAMGAKCLIGDQMEPCGELSKPVYDLIGSVYAQVEEKEPWCENVVSISDIGVLTPEEFCGANRADLPDSIMGVERMFDKLGYQFDIIDTMSDFNKYKLLVLPDNIPVNKSLNAKLEAYIKNDGKVIATFESGFSEDKLRYNFLDAGIKLKEEQIKTIDGDLARGRITVCNEYIDYILPKGEIGNGLPETEHVMYAKGLEIKPNSNTSILANIIKPYFDRTYEHFCSHRQTPSSGEVEGAGIVKNGNVIYFANPIFSVYNIRGAKWYKTLMKNAVDMLLKDKIIEHNGPSTLFVSINSQEKSNRYIAHYLNYIPERGCQEIDIIEDVIPLYNVRSKVRINKKVKKVQLVPQCVDIQYVEKDGTVEYDIEKINGHQMISIEFD